MNLKYLCIFFIGCSFTLFHGCRPIREKKQNVRITQGEPLSKDVVDKSILYVALDEKGTKNLYAYDMIKHQQTLLLKDFPNVSERSDLQLIPEKKMGLVVFNQSRVRVFSTSGEKVIFDKTFSRRVGNASLSPNGKWFSFFKRSDGSSKVSDELTIANVSTGEVQIAPAVHQQECNGLFWSADSSKIITTTSVPESKGELTNWTITEAQSLERKTQQSEPFLYTNTRIRSYVTKKGKKCSVPTRYSFKPDDEEKNYREATGIEIFKNNTWKSIMQFETGPEIISTDVEMEVGTPSPTCEVIFYPMANELFLIDLKTSKFIRLFDKSQKPELIQISQPI